MGEGYSPAAVRGYLASLVRRDRRVLLRKRESLQRRFGDTADYATQAVYERLNVQADAWLRDSARADSEYDKSQDNAP